MLPSLQRRIANFKRGSLEREEAREELQDKEEMIRLLLDSTAEAIYGLDMEGRCTICNPACLRLLGYENSGELVGKFVHELTHYKKADGTPYSRETCPIMGVTRNGTGIHVMDEVFWRADHTSFPVEYFSLPMRRQGVIVGAVVTFLDVSERKKLEEQLLQSQKMEAMGQLAGGVAHDFNNLLTIITGYSELLLQTLPANDSSRKALEEIRKAGERSASLTRQLLFFSRKHVIVPNVIDLNHAVQATENLLRRVIGEDIAFSCIMEGSLNRVRADSGQLEQILLNLSINARDAMPRGGKLTIETSNVELDLDFTGKHPDAHPGSYALLAVSDSGMGMTEEHKQRIFEPFFTTKAVGLGTGLGLAVVQGAVKLSGGFIDVQSETGVGTTFRIYLPRVDQQPDEKPDFPGLAQAPRGTETILLVEDEEAVRALLSNVLQASGYTVLVAANAEEALNVGAQYSERIHLLATDVVMPGEGGRFLSEKILATRPNIKVLYLSGYTDDTVIRNGILQENVNFLQKPFTPNILAHKVREILSKAGVN